MTSTVEPTPVICGCGRSPTGFCTGLHDLSDEEWDARVFDEAFDASTANKHNGTEQQ